MKKEKLKFSSFSNLGKIAILFMILLIFMAIFSPYVCSHPYNLPSGSPFEPPNGVHWFGTDDLGMDLFSQICYGARISLLVGISAALIAGIGGGILGILAGYYGGIIDKIIMRIVDIMIVLPDLPMMIILGAFFGPSIKNIIFVLAFFSWTGPARIVRSKVLSMKKENYILVAESYGAGFGYLLFKHFIPEILPILMVTIIKLTSKAIVAEAGLAFLGLGDPTSKSWGLILNHAINFRGIYFTDFWKWWVMAPLIAIIFLVLSIAIISRDLEKILNEKL
ncbi:ABC transporter permease [Sporanaerobacter acetigenes]|uniref:Peptide/nickel transport system permease protein n=1 Tax=Sporanaerobacter acetigenes DSM 13106 TaxID=1123281 RepID=A0A1M5WCV0_9FIRM|nr:ABC transporter permease [Sporanaerobacter acetigenes]SHH85267.1 peptide/nickel transport system permease protein [Sporanaerobacter acetigenes DSM 13106]